MKHKISAILVFILNITMVFTQTDITISANDFDPLTGDWYGNLTYLDYSSNKPYTMPADLSISKIENENKLVMKSIYPDEPNANSTDTLVISPDGTMIDKETVTSVKQVDNGLTEVLTEYSGKDGNDNKPAIIRHTYRFNKDNFTISKDVQFEGESNWINRHVYSYNRIKPKR